LHHSKDTPDGKLEEIFEKEEFCQCPDTLRIPQMENLKK
jgi:hypothetical protein